MIGILKYEAIKFENGSVNKITDPISIEKALQISINGAPFTVVMQTPGNEIDLAWGLLFSEDILKPNAKAEIDTRVDESGMIDLVNFKMDKSILGKGYLSSRSLLSVSSCGICGKQNLEDVKIEGQNKLNSELNFTPEQLFKFQEILNKSQTIFPQTGSTHGTAIFNDQHELLVCREDIGRHNALDKSLGYLIQNNQLSDAKILSFSGRISYEIVIKSFRAKIKIIIAFSAPSSLAIDFAKEFGISLIGYCRTNKLTCYTNPYFLKTD